MAASPLAAAAVLNPPYSLQAEDLGLVSLGNTVDLLGPYQASGAFVMRTWAHTYRSTLERYLAGYILSLRWLLDPTNRDRCIAMLGEKLRLSPPIAARSYAALVDPKHGLARDAQIDPIGLDNTLALRREMLGGDLGHSASDYVDLSFYRSALALIANEVRA
jgi:ABC-type nitrate/sulfonate/bicarbonate transport system substrate-binding protein